MCHFPENESVPSVARSGVRNVVSIDDLSPYAEFICSEPEVRRSALGFIGYGATKPGDKVLLAVDTHYDPLLVETIAKALRDKGAKVDVVVVDVGPDRQFDEDELDEVRAIIRRRPWQEEPRRYEGIPWIEELVQREKYDLLIHGKGGGPPMTPYRYECFPWITREHFTSKATMYPREVHTLINEKAWGLIWKLGRGGTVHLTDPEGTDLTYTLWEDYFDSDSEFREKKMTERERRAFGPKPVLGHLMGHPPVPYTKEDMTGVVAGTTSHFSRPFPQIKVHFDGSVKGIEGGGKYGEAWSELLEETRNIQYPSFPGPGLFWLWEVGIGTNVKVCRPSNIHMLSSGGPEWERRRSGVIHIGIGTFWRGPDEVWAGQQGIAYGHLHVHLLFPTLEITTKEGEKVKVIDRGRLTALDDPEVRAVASKYGDPDEVLCEDWVPVIPGISADGSYEDFAKDPIPWIYAKKQPASKETQRVTPPNPT